MANTRYIKVFVVRVTCDVNHAKWYNWPPRHDDYVWGVYQTEKEARKSIENHVNWLNRGVRAKTMKNYWITVERKSDGVIHTASVHSTHVYKGKRDYTNTTYRYAIFENTLYYKGEL